MIDYALLAESLCSYFGTRVGFENGKTSLLVTKHAVPDEGKTLTSIFSAEFSFTEEKLDFVVWFEVDPKEKEKHQKTVSQLNEFAGNYRPGTTTFELNESIGRMWIGVKFVLIFSNTTPYQFFGKFYYSVTTDLCKRVFERFCSPSYGRLNLFRPVWAN